MPSDQIKALIKKIERIWRCQGVTKTGLWLPFPGSRCFPIRHWEEVQSPLSLRWKRIKIKPYENKASAYTRTHISNGAVLSGSFAPWTSWICRNGRIPYLLRCCWIYGIYCGRKVTNILHGRVFGSFPKRLPLLVHWFWGTFGGVAVMLLTFYQSDEWFPVLYVSDTANLSMKTLYGHRRTSSWWYVEQDGKLWYRLTRMK